MLPTMSGECTPPYALATAPVEVKGIVKFAMTVRLKTVGSSRPMVPDTPLPNWAVYWMLFTPVTVS
jgi:hypothetical protein